MKIWLKKWGIGILGVIMITIFAVDRIKIKSLKESTQLQLVELSALQDTVSIHTSRTKLLTFKVKAVEVESGNRKKALEVLGIENKDLKERNIKLSDINFLLNAKLVAIGTGTTTLMDTVWMQSPIQGGDTVYASNYIWSNNHLSLKGTIVKNEMSINYRYQTGMTFVNEKKGKTNIVSAYLVDPNAKVTTANSIVITNKIRWYERPYIWGLAGLASGYILAK